MFELRRNLSSCGKCGDELVIANEMTQLLAPKKKDSLEVRKCNHSY